MRRGYTPTTTAAENQRADPLARTTAGQAPSCPAKQENRTLSVATYLPGRFRSQAHNTGRAAALTHPENGRKNLTLGPEGHTAAHLLAGCASFSLHTSTSAAAPPFRSLDLILPL